ncbi:MAG TPA: hypothetical protein VK116_20545, partial [Planctomycetota bacterium]|nr:hypothetical protein [Planctomycetota bacterium]
MRSAPRSPALCVASVTISVALHLAIPGALLAEGEAALTATELAERLEDLEAEIAEEESRLARLEEAQEAELAKLRDERRQLAERTLELEIERGANEEQLERLREQAAALRSEQPALESAIESLVAGARTAAERLRIHLREVPGSDAAIARLE